MTPEEIDDLFKGYGMAIRRVDDPPVPGEPVMSIATAKEICRAALQSLTEKLAEMEAEQTIFIRQINGLVEKLAKADAEIDKLQGWHEEWKRIDQQHRDGHDQALWRNTEGTDRMANLKKREAEIMLIALEALWDEIENRPEFAREVKELHDRIRGVPAYNINIPAFSEKSDR